jgi:hypothetical protein
MTSEPPQSPRYVRLQIELIAEITDEKLLKDAALVQVENDEYLEDAERAESVEAIELDPTGAVAHFIDPVELLADVPGVDLVQATWESQPVDFDPEEESWDFYEEDGEDSPDGEPHA